MANTVYNFQLAAYRRAAKLSDQEFAALVTTETLPKQYQPSALRVADQLNMKRERLRPHLTTVYHCSICGEVLTADNRAVGFGLRCEMHGGE